MRLCALNGQVTVGFCDQYNALLRVHKMHKLPSLLAYHGGEEKEYGDEQKMKVLRDERWREKPGTHKNTTFRAYIRSKKGF